MIRTAIRARDLAERLADTGLRLVGGDGDAVIRSAACTVFDPMVALPDGVGGVLLGVGLDASTPGVLTSAADAGYSIAIIREPAAAITQSPLPLAVVPDQVSWLHLERLISTVLSRIDGDGGTEDLFELANNIASLVGGATTIEDTEQKVLAYSTLTDQPIDADRQAAIVGRRVPDLPENDELYASVYAASGPIRLAGIRPGDLGRVAVAVRAGDQLFGSLWAIETLPGSMGEDEFIILHRAAEMAALHLLRQRTQDEVRRRQRSDQTRRALEGGPDAALRIAGLGMDPAGPFAVAAVAGAEPETDADRIRWERFVAAVSAYLAGWQSTGQLTVSGSTAYLLLGGTIAREPDRIALNLDLLVDRAERLGLSVRAGIGRSVERAEHLHRSRDDADLLVLLPRRPHDSAVATASGARSRLSLFTLARLAAEEPLLISPVALALLEHDARRGTDLARTLRVWCEQGMDLAATARTLTVHVNTVRYRLDRARQMFGPDPDPDDLLMIWLSLRVLDPTA